MMETYVFPPMGSGPIFVKEVYREPYPETSVHHCGILRSRSRCPVCNGEGVDGTTIFGGKRTCPLCKGTGLVRI